MAFSFSEFLRSGALMSLSKEHVFVGWGNKKKTCMEYRDCNKAAFYFPDFFLNDPLPWIEYEESKEMSIDELLQEFSNVSNLLNCQWMIDSKEKFKFLFEDLMELLQQGVLQKAVPYLFTRSAHLMNKSRLQHCIKKGLLSVQQGFGFVYGYWDSDKGILGITPERLFSYSQQEPKKISTMALAGTSQLSDCREEFIKNEKQLKEHQFVIEGISQALASLGNIQVKTLEVVNIPPLRHLMTPIELELTSSFHFDTLVRHLHPTPALGALPIDAGKTWLEKYQQHLPRHYYGAPLGWHDPQKGDALCLVGIRNIQWNPLEMFIGAGSGIISQSVFEKEWEEIQLKIRAIQEMFEI